MSNNNEVIISVYFKVDASNKIDILRKQVHFKSENQSRTDSNEPSLEK